MRAYQQASRMVRHDRDQLIAEHLGMAKRIALRMARNANRPESREEFIGAAMMGLVEAADRYDPARAEPFAGFAHTRIRGAVIDSMRRDDIVPRRVRSMANRAGVIMRELEQTLGRPPEDEEVAEKLGVDVKTYRDKLEAVSRLSFVELGPQLPSHPDAPGTRVSWQPEEQTEKNELSKRLRQGLDRLPERDAQVLSLYYVEELTYAEVGKILGVSEARVCQLHSRAVLRLRAELDEGEAAR